jgi:hypothetical protein
MFRSNRPRRFGQRLGQQRLAQPALIAIKKAHRLMALGEYHQAAELFSQLGQTAHNLGRPQQAANLHAQAGLVWAEARNAEATVLQGQLALRAFIALNQYSRSGSYLARLTSALRLKGLTAAADQLQAEFADHLSPESAPSIPHPAPQVRSRLPVSCPQCGAPVRSDDVEWIDAFSAECAFCGGVIQGS